MDPLEQHLALLEHCARNNPAQFNRDKATEEASEFLDAVLKRQTKHPDNPKRPTTNDILTEYGDFIYRGIILLMQEFPELTINDITEKVGEHVAMKLDKLQQWKDEGKYEGGL